MSKRKFRLPDNNSYAERIEPGKYRMDTTDETEIDANGADTVRQRVEQ